MPLFFGESSMGSQGSSLVLQSVANASVIGSSFVFNSNATHGRAMYVTDSSFSIVGSYFTGNEVLNFSGAVYTHNSSFTFFIFIQFFKQ